jgi:rSAM/selenodomain-associated transferase 1
MSYQGHCAIVVIAKAPRAGASKTRLCPPLTPVQAAELARAFLRDTLELALHLPHSTVTVFHSGAAEEEQILRGVVPGEVGVMGQGSYGLGAGLVEAAARHFASGAGRVLLMDSDSPTLPPAYLAQARTALATHDAVLGPCEDGGYYLLGLRAPQPGLFADVAWSTPAVVAQTRDRARTLGLSMALLPTWYDVDDAAALDRLRTELCRGTDGAPQTRACLEMLTR